jgi:hypothetical protein
MSSTPSLVACDLSRSALILSHDAIRLLLGSDDRGQCLWRGYLNVFGADTDEEASRLFSNTF